MKSNLVSLAVFLAGFAAAPLPGMAATLLGDTTSGTGPALYTSAPDDTTSSLTTYTFTPDPSAFVTNPPGASGVSLGGSGLGEIKQGTGPSAVPEPPTWAMLILGAGMIGYAARRRSLRVSSDPIVV